jgi:hypothetical protein
MRIKLTCLACVVLLAGCSSADPRSSASFAKLATLKQFVDHVEDMQLYEGLPHQAFEPELLAKELTRNDTIDFDGHHFYAQPVSINVETRLALRRLCTDPSMFSPQRVDAAKACGGFHPDWRITWTQGSDSRSFLFCFGCQEVKIYALDALIVHCDIKDLRPFADMLKPLRRNRQESPLPLTDN